MNPVCGCNTEPKKDRSVISLPWFTVLECSSCKLWYVDTLLRDDAGRKLADRHASETYLEDFAPGYLDSPPSDRQAFQFHRALEAAMRICPNGDSLLDAGCGSGKFLQFAARFRSWRRLVGIDVSPHLTRMCKEKGFDAVTGDIHEMPFGVRSFDVVTMWDVIEHLASPYRALSEASRVLRLGGVMIIGTPNRSSILHSLAILLYRLSLPMCQKPAQRVFSGHPLYFSWDSLSLLLKRVGIEPMFWWQHGVRSEMSFRGEPMEIGADIIDSTIGRLTNRRYRMILVGSKSVGPTNPLVV